MSRGAHGDPAGAGARYYERKARDSDPARRLPTLGLEDKEIPFVIELATDGRVNQLIDTRSLDGKKLRARSYLVPQGEKKTSGVKANLLWDSAEYVIGLERNRKGKADLLPALAYRARIDGLPDAARADPGVCACSPHSIAPIGGSCVREHGKFRAVDFEAPLVA